MGTTYERQFTIERAASDKAGVIRGILATSGEASDGHILSIEGLRAEAPAPLLFGHDSWGMEGTLGSWTSFSKSNGDLRGVAEIEMGGEEAQASKRRDLAHMIDRGHVRGFSVRWEPMEPPVARVNLSKDHPAFVDASKERDQRKLYGMFFPSSRLLEGSVVTLGADPKALIGRMRETQNEVRGFWRGVVERMMIAGELNGELRERTERFATAVRELRESGIEDLGTLLRVAGDPLDPSKLVAVTYGDAKRLLIPREAYDALLAESTNRLRTAFDLLAEDTGSRFEVADQPTEPEAPAGSRDENEDVSARKTAPLSLDAIGALLDQKIGADQEQTRTRLRELASTRR